MNNLYFKRFKESENKNEFIANLAKDFDVLLNDSEYDTLIDSKGNYIGKSNNSFYSKITQTGDLLNPCVEYEHITLKEKMYMYEDLLETVTLDDNVIKLETEEEIELTETLICFQPILDYDSLMMFLVEESLTSFFYNVFQINVEHFIGDNEDELTLIEYEGIKALYYNTIYKGVPRTGILFI